MKITMIHTKRESDDGFTVRKYEAGKTYEVGDVLGCKLVQDGAARVADKSEAA